MGGQVKEMLVACKESDIEEIFSSLEKERPWFVLGGGSNCIFPENDIFTIVIRMDDTESTPHILEETDTYVRIKAWAGISWDAFVADMVARGFSGIEALSAIPGTVGATPIQNVGAYGTEVKDVIETVEVFDTQTRKFTTLANSECLFAYRDSLFKKPEGRKYVVTNVIFKLSKNTPKAPNYPGVADYFKEIGVTDPTLVDIRSAICAIRARKLPDPKEIASVGSFFKNPIIPKEQADTLKEKYPTLAVFPVSDTESKVGAGSMIDTMGWKGKSFGRIGIYEHNALVLTNLGGATHTELDDVVNQIKQKVQETYGITLEMEPELLKLE